MTKNELLNILAEFFENNTNIIERFIEDSVIPNTTIESFIDEIRNDTEGVPGWILYMLQRWDTSSPRIVLPIEYIIEDQVDDTRIYTYSGEKFCVTGIEEGDSLIDVYTVEYKEVPIMVKKWVRI